MLSEVLIVASPGRAPRIECAGGLAGRRTDTDTVHLVSAAATPLGGDTISIRVVVEAGAVLRVRSAAATMAMPGTVTMESRATWDLEVHGVLDVDPQPTIVAGAARHVTSTRLTLGHGATVRLRERVQIGRSHERHGSWSGSVRADADATPLLRHRVEIGAGAVTDDELAAPRAYVSELRYPQADFAGVGTMLHLAAGGCLATWQGDRL